MQVDFYQLSRDPVERVVPLLAQKVLTSGARLSIAVRDDAMAQQLSDALWAREAPAFLAHGRVGDPHDARQPILLGPECSAANGATMALIADGEWRDEATMFARVMLLFDTGATDAARALWRRFAADEAMTARFFRQDDRGAWTIAG